MLRGWAGRFGAPLTDQQVAAFKTYCDELLTWNANRANLTAITDPAEVESRLFLESLWCAAALPQTSGLRLIDVGSGGGFPGLPLVIAFPGLDVTLLEATGKKVDFLQHMIACLKLPNARAIHGRAEDLAHDSEHREAYDVATARALAPLPALLELCLPFMKVGGMLIAPKGADAEQEVDAASNALSVLGGEAQGIILPEPDSPISADHRLVVIRKVAPTPDSHPRRAGVPARRPL
ncbi:MAG: 16S rRNA (guanine(527)-N(7))-methyltransferase RsmG [Dehalococcoidia bacterium]|nr:16S rRNA (guanine(527)-N(7))-methyltransferase RsmG [Dehalococcoidia bacterium]